MSFYEYFTTLRVVMTNTWYGTHIYLVVPYNTKHTKHIKNIKSIKNTKNIKTKAYLHYSLLVTIFPCS